MEEILSIAQHPPTRDTVNVKHGRKVYCQTMLMLAIRYSPAHVGAILDTEGLDINIQDMFGWTALHCAIHSNPPSAWQILQRPDVDLTLTCTSGRTMLMMACYDDQVHLGMELLRRNVNPNLFSHDGGTALMEACYWSPSLALALIAYPGIKTDAALARAICRDHPHVVLALVRHPEVDLWAKTEGEYPLNRINTSYTRYAEEYRALLSSGMRRDVLWALMGPRHVPRLHQGKWGKLPADLVKLAVFLL